MRHVRLLNPVTLPGAQDHSGWPDFIENNLVAKEVGKNLPWRRLLLPCNPNPAAPIRFKCVFHF